MLENINALLQNLDQQEKFYTSELHKIQEFRVTLEQAKAKFAEGEQPPAIPHTFIGGGGWGSIGITEGAARLLEEGPMDTREIADQLRLRGVKTKSKSFIPTVYASLRESNRFVRLKDLRKWDLSSRHAGLAAEKRLMQKEPTTVAKKGATAKRKGNRGGVRNGRKNR